MAIGLDVNHTQNEQDDFGGTVKILGIDTATDICVLALTDDRSLIAELRLNIKRAHGEKLISALDHLLDEAGSRLQDIQCLAVSIGPGSFTGLRIGLAVVKGLTLSLRIPVVAVPTLDALAWQAYFWRDQICPLIKAQADEAYTALYQFQSNELIRKTDFQLITLAALDQFIDRKTLILNAGMKNLDDFLTAGLRERVEVAPAALAMPSGYSVAYLGMDKIERQEFEDIDRLEPFYLKDFKAKRKVGI